MFNNRYFIFLFIALHERNEDLETRSHTVANYCGMCLNSLSTDFSLDLAEISNFNITRPII